VQREALHSWVARLPRGAHPRRAHFDQLVQQRQEPR
jgi:hypothetical protein